MSASDQPWWAALRTQWTAGIVSAPPTAPSSNQKITRHFATRGPVQPEAVIEIQCVRKRTGERPAPAGILALSSFVPTVDGWQASLADRTPTRAFIAHGRSDPVIDVGFARQARELLQAGGRDVSYHEFEGGYRVDPAALSEAVRVAGADRRADAG
jgi:hypothetical protein